MADSRYRKGTKINRHTAPLPSRWRELELRGWTYSHINEDHNQPVYKLGEAKLMFYQDNWLVEYPHYETPVFYQGFNIKEVTEDVRKELEGC